MSRIVPLFFYKMRFFFGPALRSRVGPLAFLGLILLFVPTGFALGFSLAEAMKGVPVAQGVNVLSAPLSFLLVLAFLYAAFAGVTAHVSEFDFFMTADLRPREYLASDLLFQFFSLFGAGGLAAVVSAFGMVWALGRPSWTALPLLAVLFAFAFVFLVIIQIITVLHVRYPKAPVRAVAGLLILVDIVPTLTQSIPEFPVRIEGWLVPTTAFGGLGYDVLMGLPLDPASLLIAATTSVILLGIWAAVSDTYIFHGIHPSLSAGFGQVDMAARMAQQRRLTAGFGKYTTGVTVRPDRGSDTGFMTRFHILRIVRDGSILFIGLFALISLLPIQVGGTTTASSAPLSILATQILTLLVALLALNWSYYERENLWIVVTAARSAAPYFRGLMMSLVAVGLVVAAIFVLVLGVAPGSVVTTADVAVPVAAAVAAAAVSTALLTRLKVQPAAFSLSMLGVLFLAVLGGYLGGYAAQAILLAGQAVLGLGAAAEAVVLAMYCAAIAAVGLWSVSRLAVGFRL